MTPLAYPGVSTAGTAIAEPRDAIEHSEDEVAVEELVHRMRWRASRLWRLQVEAGSPRALDRGGLRVLHVSGGTVTLRSRPATQRASQPEDEPVTLRTGDVALLQHAHRHELRSESSACVLIADLTVEAVGFEELAILMPTVLFACGYRLDDPAYAGVLELIDRELSREDPRPSTLVDRLIDVVVAAAMREWLRRGCANARTWLAHGRDPQLRRALDAIHAEPGSPWRVEELARLAHSSRSQFAERFRSSVGESPARYVTGVRMRRAEELLRAGRPVSEVAFALGYDSDEGFSRAFRRHTGLAPSVWRRSGEATS